MPSIDTRMGAIEAILERMEATWDAVEVQRQQDHDALTALTEQVKALRDDVTAIKADRKEQRRSEWSRVWHVVFLVMAAAIGASFSWLAEQIKRPK